MTKSSPVQRLMKNYADACRRRLRIWVSPQVQVESSDLTIEVRLNEKSLFLTFLPSRCIWTMEGFRKSEGADFDRLLKKARQALTLSDGS